MKKVYYWIVALILLTAVITGIFLEIAPDTIPAHYDLQGQVDRMGSKYEFLLFPFINLLFGAFMAWLARLEGTAGRDQNERIVGIMTLWVLLLFNGMFVFFMWKALSQAQTLWELGALGEKTLLLLLMTSLIPIGNLMPKAERNSIFGLRTKWSMANDRCWQQSQRLGGFASVILGLLGVVLTSLCPVRWGGYISLAIIGILLVVSLWGSYRIWREDAKQQVDL